MDSMSFVKDNSISLNDFITHFNILIFEGEKDELFSIINKLFLSDRLNLEILKVLSIRIFVNIDSISEEFDILNKYNRESLIHFISSICKVDNKNYLRCIVTHTLDEIIRSKDNFGIYSPIVYRGIKYINENYNSDLSIREFCLDVNINPVYFGRKFKQEVGCSFSYYLNKKRIDLARDFVVNTDKKISDISLEVGYLDVSHFYKQFKKNFGIPPAKLREIE